MSQAFGILRRSRRFTLLMGVVALLVLSFWATEAQAAYATLKVQNCDFYSDASHSTVVGWAYYDCNGRIVQQSGTSSDYSTCSYDYCCSECDKRCVNFWC
jgi:spermidine/putrescine-binding protein